MWEIGPCTPPEAAGVQRGTIETPEALRSLAAPPLFIVGTGRAGKTMVYDLFDRHPQVHAIFESWLMTPHVGVTGIFHQPQWHPGFYEQQLERVGHEHAAVSLVSYEQAARELGAMIARWMVASMPEGTRYLVEKTPAELGPLAVMFPNARVVHVVRDGRDVVASMLRASRSWAPGMGGEDPARFWCDRVNEIREGAARFGADFRQLRFEDMRRDMAGETRALFEWAGIPVSDELLPELLAGTAPDAYAQSARDSGFRGSGTVGGWRDTMTRAEGEHFDEVAGDLLVELGYADGRDWWRDLPRRRK